MVNHRYPGVAEAWVTNFLPATNYVIVPIVTNRALFAVSATVAGLCESYEEIAT